MNPSTMLGMVGGILLLGSAIAVTAKDATIFLNLPGLVVVLGGTLAAALISFPLLDVIRAFRASIIVFRNERLYAKDDIKEIVLIASLWRANELARVEDELTRINNPFLRTGIQLVIDGTPVQDINGLLRWRIAQLRSKERAEAQVFRNMGAYAPAFGMIGTLLGLVNMLHEMGSGGFDDVGLNMAVALITTFYGILLANLVFKPVAVKLERRTDERVTLLQMVMEGVSLITQQRSPTFIRETLKSFMIQHKDEVRGIAVEDGAVQGVAD